MTRVGPVLGLKTNYRMPLAACMPFRKVIMPHTFFPHGHLPGLSRGQRSGAGRDLLLVNKVLLLLGLAQAIVNTIDMSEYIGAIDHHPATFGL